MIPNHARLLSAAGGLAAFLCSLASASAQEYTWVETIFHRVHLRNGNFIDGKVLDVTQRDVLLRLRDGDMSIRSNTVDRIELMKMRSLFEKPKLDPPLKKVPAVRKTSDQPARVKSSRLRLEVSDELKSNVAAILNRIRIASPAQKESLIDELARQPGVSPYLASLMPTLDEEPSYMVRSALMRAKDRSASPYLVEALSSDRIYIQINSLTLLSVLGDREVVPEIRHMLDAPNAAVKATAIDTLQQLSDGNSLTLIADLMAQSDDMVRVAAINAAIELARKTDRMDVIEDVLRRCLHGQTGRTARDLLGAAARSGRQGLWMPVSEYLRDVDPALRRGAAEALTVLASQDSVQVITDRLIREDDSRTAVQLARATAVLRTKAAIPVLIDLLRSREDTVVQAASTALGTITREEFGTSHERWSAWWTRSSAK